MKNHILQSSIPPEDGGVVGTSTTNTPEENHWVKGNSLAHSCVAGYPIKSQKSQQVAICGTNNDLQSSLNNYSVMIENNKRLEKKR